MTCHLQFVPRDGMRVDHFLVTKLTWHHAATPEYMNTMEGRRVRADVNSRFDAPGLTASQDVNIRITQIPIPDRTSTRIYEDEF
jgi:hypothetical protein